MTTSACVLIIAAGVIAYSNSFAGIFVFDDEPALEQNPHLLSLWPLSGAMQAPPDTTLSGRPVASLSFAIDHAIWGGSLVGYHATNLAIHLGVACLLLLVIRRTLRSASLVHRFAESATLLAFVVALLFVVHPLQTASVTYLVQRVESLMSLFYLATIYCCIRAREEGTRARGFWTGAAILACALGMGTKEVMVTAPLMVVLWDRQFEPDRGTSRTPLYAGLAATWIILGAILATSPRGLSAGFGFENWPWWRYLMTQSEVVPHYLRLAFFPSPLVLDYEWPPVTGIAAVVFPAGLLCLLLIATAWGLLRRAPAAFASAWCLLILAPTSSVVPIVTEVAAEHRMYLPLAGVLALTTVAVFGVGRRLAAFMAPKFRPVLFGAGSLVAFVIVIVFARMTYERNEDYADYERIWTDTIAKRPHNARARNNYATSLLAKGRFAEAEPHLRVAVAEKPSMVEAQLNLGVALSALGLLDEGALHLRSAIAQRPDYPSAHRNLAENLALQRRWREAAAEYAKALESLPEDVSLLNRAAWILATSSDDQARDGARARGFAERAVTLTQRRDPESLDSLGAALAELGEFGAAASAAREALALARLQGDSALLGDLTRRVALYERGLQFREP